MISIFKEKDLESRLYESDVEIENPYETREDKILTGLGKISKYLATLYSAINKAWDYGKKIARKAILTGLVAGMCYGSGLAYAGEISGSIPPEVLQWIGGTTTTAWVCAKQSNEMFVIGYTNVDVGDKEHPVPYRIRNLPAGTYTIRCFGFFFDMVRARYHDMTGIDGKSEIVLGENEKIEGISYPDTDIWAKGWNKELYGGSGWIIIYNLS